MNKTDLLLQMLEHPHAYTADEWQQILSDDECRQLYALMAKTRSAVDADRADELTDADIDAAWQRLARPRRKERSGYKVAAAIVGVIFLSGIAYAAILPLVREKQPQEQTVTDRQTAAQVLGSADSQPLPTDTVATTAPKVFDNVPLSELLPEVAQHYGYTVSFAGEQAKTLRLYFRWNPDEPLEQAVKELNLFEQVNIRMEGQTLIVE